MAKSKVADPLREWAKTFEGYASQNNGSGVWLDGEDLLTIANDIRIDADEVDAEHQRRMWQCEREVRKRLCTDVRWAVNMLEKCVSRGWIRSQFEDGGQQ